MQIVVTGATGQDGSLMADYLLANTDAKIFGVYRRLSVDNHDNIEHIKNNPRFELIEGDVSDPHSMSGIISKIRPDYFINFAANSFVGDSWKTPTQMIETNTMSVVHQLEAIRRHSLKTRYYQAGSSEEFGDVVYAPQDEKHPLRPRSPYGASKASARHIVKVYRESYGLYAVAGWLFNHESERRGKMFVTRKITQGVARIKKTIDAHLSHQRITSPRTDLQFAPIELGNLDAKRDWSYAGDFIDGIWRMLNQDIYNEKIFHATRDGSLSDAWKYVTNNIQDYVLSSEKSHSIRDFVEAAFSAAGIHIKPSEGGGYELPSKHPVVVINQAFYRPAEINVLLGNSKRAHEELGWFPKKDFNDLVRLMVSHDLSKSNLD